jgi:predicted HAD superfamily phosphohydrolase YqeG
MTLRKRSKRTKRPEWRAVVRKAGGGWTTVSTGETDKVKAMRRALDIQAGAAAGEAMWRALVAYSAAVDNMK